MTLLLQLPEWLQGDGLKIAIFVGFLAGFFALARWASAATERSTEPHPDVMLPPGRGSEEVEYHPPQYLEEPQGAGPREEAPRHPEMRYGDVELRDLNFKTFEAMVGPPDPACFCDEIMLDLYNVATGHQYFMSFVVATPEGLRKVLDDKKWDIICLSGVYVVNRYDLKVIRDTILKPDDEGGNSLEEMDPPPAENVDPFKNIN